MIENLLTKKDNKSVSKEAKVSSKKLDGKSIMRDSHNQGSNHAKHIHAAHRGIRVDSKENHVKINDAPSISVRTKKQVARDWARPIKKF